MSKELEDNIKLLYNSAPPASNSTGMEDTIIKVRQLVKQSEDKPLSFWKFFFLQFGFMRKKVWFIQIVIILAFSIKLTCSSKGVETLAMISSAAPLLVIAGIKELARSYTYEMAEIELSTTYSFKQLMITRITILGLIDILGLTILLILSGVSMKLHLIALILYIFVPFLVTCFGCLFILNNFKSMDKDYKCILFGLFVMIMIFIITYTFPNLYEPSACFIWSIMFLISLIGVIREIYKLGKICDRKFDGVIM
ncbi:hypothetical protein [Clostridium niameyense]|uniref:hypothetical protein n=1 Tax=Clostridium niameyense TaxID=1622073 RepID=UPI00067EE8DA|nr:hypothetical protein [Clostridium niameyense]